MKNTYKRLFSMAVAVIMSVSMVGALPAAAEVAYSFDDYLENYFDTSLADCLYEYGYSENEEHYVSYPIEYTDYLSGETEGSYVFVFENDDIIGKLRTYTYDDNQYIVFDECIPAGVQSMYDNGEDIAITIDGDYTFVVSETDSVPFDVDDDVKMDKPVELSAKIDKAREVHVTDPAVRSASLGNYTIKGIVHVPNGYLNGVPVMCWEACVAMKANYLNGTDLTAYDVYDYIGCPDPYSISSRTIKEAYAHYGMDVTHYTKTQPTISNLLQELRNNDAIELIAKDKNNTRVIHAVLLYGMHVYDDKTDFYILDPDWWNDDGKATVTVYGRPETTQKNFAYKTGYGNHLYEWIETRY